MSRLLLRIGLAFAFLYPPIDAIFEPYSWEGYFPAFLRHLPIDPLLLLHGFGVIEVVIAAWILYGKHLRIPATLAGLMLVAIVAFNSADFPVLFRDLAIAMMAFALAAWPEEKAVVVA